MDFVKFWLRLRPAIVSLVIVCGGFGSGAARPQAETDAGQAGPAEVIEHYADEVQDMTARFEQRLYDADGELVESETSSGSLSLLRPDRFRLHYETPYEEIVVSDGEWIWQYDVELEQVTCAPLSDLATSPAMLLSGAGSVSENFVVSDVASDDDRRWIELVPVDDDGEFQSAKIAFREGIPDELELVDGVSQLTRVELADVKVNTGLRRREFDFDRPRGVDVIGECN